MSYYVITHMYLIIMHKFSIRCTISSSTSISANAFYNTVDSGSVIHIHCIIHVMSLSSTAASRQGTVAGHMNIQ